MKSLLLSALFFAFSFSSFSQEPPSTEYFEFYNNYWINLHHYLYQEASNSQLNKLKEDGFGFMAIGEDEAMVDLSEFDFEMLDQAINYYKENIISKNLRTELGQLRLWLQAQDEDSLISDTLFSKDFVEVLNRASAVYRSEIWEVHKKYNDHVLKDHLENISKFEKAVIGKMEELSHCQWPDSLKVRVDITTYANYAGAYTATRPKMNIFLSTIDPLNTTSSFEETIFHEGSHLLFRFGKSPVRDSIYYKAQNMQMEFPKHLWHACLFYLCGKATQEELISVGIEHQFIMDVRNIYSEYNTQVFRETLDQYYYGELDLSKTVETLLKDL